MEKKTKKSFFIFDRNDLIVEDLRDDLPPYMQNQVKQTWGDEYLDVDASEKIPEIPDQRLKIAWNDIGADKDEILMGLTGSVSEKLMDELRDDLDMLSGNLTNFFEIIKFDQVMKFGDGSQDLDVEFSEIVSEMKRDVMYNSTESLEEHLEYIIKLLFDNVILSIDFSKTEFDHEGDKISFTSYDNRLTSFPKFLNKLQRYTNQVADGKKTIETDDYAENEVIKQANLISKMIDILKKRLKSGALKSIIKGVVDQVSEMRNGDVFPEILISSKAEDFLRMSISPFYSSCQELYSGSYRRQLLSNVFDKNSKILYIVINKPFTDCRGNEHPYTPIVRSVIRKLQGDEYALDQIYKPTSIDLDVDELQTLLNSKLDTQWFDDERWSNVYEVEYGVESEAIYKLPPTYSDKFTVTGEGDLLTIIQEMDEEEAKDLIVERTGYQPERIEPDGFVVFNEMSLGDTVYGLDPCPIKNLYDFFDGDELDQKLDTENIFPILQYYLAEHSYFAKELYEYLNRVMGDEMLKYRETLRHSIDPRKDLLPFFETHNLDGTIRELERGIRREIKGFELDDEKKAYIFKYISYLVQFGYIANLGSRVEVRWNQHDKDIMLLEGVDEESVAILEGEYSDSELITRAYEEGFIDTHTMESMEIDRNNVDKQGITKFLKQFTKDEEFISLLHAVAENGLSPKLFYDEIEKALMVFLR